MITNIFSLTFLGCLLILITINFPTTTAQFGVPKVTDELGLGDGEVADMLGNVSDQELAEAFQMFASMSPDEMQETMEELKSLMGDDPEAMAEIEAVMNELAQMSPEELSMTLEDLMQEEDAAFSIAETMDLLANADDSMWEDIIAQKDVLLDSIFAAGGFTEEEYQAYQEVPEAWENELRDIWEELRQDAQSETGSDGNDEL